MDDEALIGAVATGDEGALRRLFDRNAPWLAGRLRRVVPVDAVADVLQETFVAVWRGAGRYQPQGKPGAWLWGIATRQAALWLRRNPIGTEIAEARPVGGGVDPAQVAADRADLAAALRTLDDGADRRLWRLLFVEDRSVADVAARLGVPVGTVKSRAFRLRRLLRAALGGQES
jgi:RNA polymerase sigma-70 factor (ECF subfamily)